MARPTGRRCSSHTLGSYGRVTPEGVPVDPDRYDYRWLAREVPKFARSVHTQENYRWAIEGHLVPGLGRIRLARLTADDVDVLLEDRAASGRLARSSVGRLRTVLGKALDHTERRNLVRGTWSGSPTCRRGRLRPGGR